MSRSRRRGGRPWHVTLALALVAVAVLGSFVPATSFTTGTVDRGSSVDIVADSDAVLALDISTGLQAGSTQLLVNVSNYLGQSVSVTISLDDGSEGDLVVGGTNEGDSTTVDLAQNGSQEIDIDVPCDVPAGETVAFSFDVSGNDLAVSTGRSADVTDGCASGTVVYATPSNRDLRTVSNSSGVNHLDATSIDVTAPKERDIDADGLNEIAFVNESNGDIWLIDENNETSLLLDASALNLGLLSSGAEPTKSRMAVGTWNGSDVSVFVANDDENKVVRVDTDQREKILESGNGVGGVSGFGDIDDDGKKELVFFDTSNNVRYLDDDGTKHKISNAGVGSNKGPGIGDPMDFDGDGHARIPFVDGSNNLALVTAGGNKTKLISGVDKAPIAAVDWDGDGAAEIVYLDGGTLYYADDIGGGSATAKQITDSNGNSVSAHKEPGAA